MLFPNKDDDPGTCPTSVNHVRPGKFFYKLAFMLQSTCTCISDQPINALRYKSLFNSIWISRQSVRTANVVSADL